MDELLHHYLAAEEGAEADSILEKLVVENAAPLVKQLLSFKLRSSSSNSNRDSQEVEDLAGEVIVKLVKKLRECKSVPTERGILSLRSYVAVMAYNASDQYLREKYPRRFSLKNKIRYILTHRPGLALWEDDDRSMICGFAAHRTKGKPPTRPWSDRAREGVVRFLSERFGATPIERANPAEVVGTVLEFAGSPLEIDELVSVMADVWRIRDAAVHSEWTDEETPRRDELSSDPRDSLDARFDQGERLDRVWNEIRQLPVRQRKALLLNLKDEQGDAVITLLPILRVASVEQIAEVLEMPAEELAAVWQELPFDDATIAESLGATRQQVANLRKCARERLNRRLRVSEPD